MLVGPSAQPCAGPASPRANYAVHVRRKREAGGRQKAIALNDLLASVGSVGLVVNANAKVEAFTPDAVALGLIRGEEVVNRDLQALIQRSRESTSAQEAAIELGPRRELFLRASRIGQTQQVLVLADDASEARRNEAVRRDFVANISHELKTPIGGLSLLAEAIAHSSDDPDAVRRFAERMQTETRRLNHLVTDIISLSQLQGTDPLYGAEVVNIDDVIDTASDRCRLQAQASEIAVVTGGDLGTKVLGDFEQLVTAVSNLLTNAIAYSPIRTQVGIGVRAAEGLVEITVTDQGIGIPQTDLERVFERFYRVDPARSRATGGTGLGLAIVKHIVANHGGTISVWSVEGEGSSFTIRLPIAAITAGVEQ